jgi:FeS assembly SUF system protein
MDAVDAKQLEEKVAEVLKTCYDPEIPVNIYELGLIYGVDVKPEGDVLITMTLTAPNCPAAQSLPAEVKAKAESVAGVKSAEVEIVFDPPWTPQKMTDSAKLVLNIL